MMSQYVTKISVLRDNIAAAGEHVKGTQLIMIALGSLGLGYDAFVTSILTRFDQSMSFSNLQQLLMDHELRMPTLVVPTGVSCQPTSVANLATRSSTASGGGKAVCQIYNKKGHLAIDCYIRINLSKYVPNHSRELFATGPGPKSIPAQANLVARAGSGVSMWNPDSEATSHITASCDNIQSPRAFHEGQS